MAEPREDFVTIYIIGVGNCGLKAVDEMAGIHGIKCLGINTEGSQLSEVSLPVLLFDHNWDMDQELASADLIYLVTFLDDVTGHLAEDVARVVKSHEIPFIVVIPDCAHATGHSVEYTKRSQTLLDITDTLLIISRDSLQPGSSLPLHTQQCHINHRIRQAIENITDLFTYESFAGLDFGDLKAVIRHGGISRIGIGEATGEHRAAVATGRALAALRDQGIVLTNCKSSFICNISGSSNLSMDDFNEARRSFCSNINEDSYIKIGIIRKEDYGDNVVITILAVNV